MGTIIDIEDTHHDTWVLLRQKDNKEFGDFASESDAKEYLTEDIDRDDGIPSLIELGYRVAFKRVIYSVHSLD